MSHDAKGYWAANVRLLTLCLVIWFVVSFGFGILMVEPLNAIKLGGYKLGFWFAQQGSIYVFVGLIFFYAWRMGQIDRQFDVVIVHPPLPTNRKFATLDPCLST